MGKCSKRPSPSPPAFVGTFPYNLLNGTAGSHLLCYGDSIGDVPCLMSSRPRLGDDVGSLMARRINASTSPHQSRRCVAPSMRNVDPPQDGDSPRHHFE
jgi:hypothetical protein